MEKEEKNLKDLDYDKLSKLAEKIKEYTKKESESREKYAEINEREISENDKK